jgi:hypothetical protein
MNAERVMTFPGLTARVGEAVLQFLQVFFVASIILAPDLPGKTRPVEVLAIGLVSWGAQVLVQVRYLKVRQGHPWSWFTWRAGLAQLATIPFISRGSCCWLGIQMLWNGLCQDSCFPSWRVC